MPGDPNFLPSDRVSIQILGHAERYRPFGYPIPPRPNEPDVPDACTHQYAHGPVVRIALLYFSRKSNPGEFGHSRVPTLWSKWWVAETAEELPRGSVVHVGDIHDRSCAVNLRNLKCMSVGELIGLIVAVVIVVAVVVVLIVALRATTVRPVDLPGHPGVKYAWRGAKGDVSALVKVFEAASAAIRQHVTVSPTTIDAALSKVLIVVYPNPKIPNPSFPTILGAPAEVWGICWAGQEVWVGSTFDALCHELCHCVLQGIGLAVTDHSRFADLGAYAAIDAFELTLAHPTV
jgi:hypothetical protein